LGLKPSVPGPDEGGNRLGTPPAPVWLGQACSSAGSGQKVSALELRPVSSENSDIKMSNNTASMNSKGKSLRMAFSFGHEFM
jgi:hypothetical protein